MQRACTLPRRAYKGYKTMSYALYALAQHYNLTTYLFSLICLSTEVQASFYFT